MNLSKIWAIARKELHCLFASPSAYILIASFLLLNGVFFYLYTIGSKTTDLLDVFGNLSIVVFMLCPLLSMKLIAEEKKNGSLELLLTSPLRTIEIVLGKYTGVLILYALMLLVTLIGPLYLAWMAEIHWPAVFIQYLGLFFLGACVLGMGMVFSSLTDNQMIAAVLAMVFSLGLFFISFFRSYASGFFLKVIDELTILNHYASFNQGVFDLKDLIYFLLWIGLAIFLSHRFIAPWRR